LYWVVYCQMGNWSHTAGVSFRIQQQLHSTHTETTPFWHTEHYKSSRMAQTGQDCFTSGQRVADARTMNNDNPVVLCLRMCVIVSQHSSYRPSATD
jgi:hypothetical protein